MKLLNTNFCAHHLCVLLILVILLVYVEDRSAYAGAITVEAEQYISFLVSFSEHIVVDANIVYIGVMIEYKPSATNSSEVFFVRKNLVYGELIWNIMQRHCVL